MLTPGIHKGITVEHILVVDGDGEAHVIRPNKYRKPFEDHPSEDFPNVEAALDFMYENTNTLSPRWPLEYIPRQARFLRALCADPEDATFASLGLTSHEEITLSEEAVDLFYEQEQTFTILEDEEAPAQVESAAARLKRLLDTDIKDLFRAPDTRTDTRGNQGGAEETRMDPSTRSAPDRSLARDDEALRGPEKQQKNNHDALRFVESFTAAGGSPSALVADTPIDPDGRDYPRVDPEIDRLTQSITRAAEEIAYDSFDWPHPHNK